MIYQWPSGSGARVGLESRFVSSGISLSVVETQLLQGTLSGELESDGGSDAHTQSSLSSEPAIPSTRKEIVSAFMRAHVRRADYSWSPSSADRERVGVYRPEARAL